MSDLDFYKQFQQQSVEVYGDVSGNYVTVPIPPTSETVEDLIAKGGLTQPASHTPVTPAAAASVSQVEQYSYGAPCGSTPAGYGPANCCSTCKYMDACGPYCYKFDYPCHANYVCDSYERMECERMECEVFADGALKLDIATLTEGEIEILADGWTSKGNVKGETRKHKAVLSEGRFPVFDKRSAVSALKLRGKAKNPKERAKIIRVAAKYAPEEASKAQEAEKQSLADVFTSDKVPSKPALFALAYDSADAVEGDLDSVYGIYTELYENCYGTKDGLFVIPEPQKEKEVEEPKAENFSEFEASVSVPSSAAETPSVTKDPLYQVAENRMLLSAKREGRSLDESEVLGEYNRLVKLRNP